ncbi:hypothetical protein PS001_24840, partial [Shigella sonnei]|nr:hypothetical protein [Shigella sonnei]
MHSIPEAGQECFTKDVLVSLSFSSCQHHDNFRKTLLPDVCGIKVHSIPEAGQECFTKDVLV